MVIRIRGSVGVSPHVRKILLKLNLRQENNATFVKLDMKMIEMLKLAGPYVVWGYPSMKYVRELIYKRGYGRIPGNSGERFALSNNAIIEEHLGNFGIICVEDLVHEIYNVGPNFTQSAAFVWPFRLSAPMGGFKRKVLQIAEGGKYGNRMEKINDLVHKML